MKPPDFKALAEASAAADGVLWFEPRLAGFWTMRVCSVRADIGLLS